MDETSKKAETVGFSVKFVFKDGTAEIRFPNLESFNKCKALKSAFSSQPPECFDDKMNLDFPMDVGKFILESLSDLVHPENMGGEPEYFRAMLKMSFPKLFNILNAADFLQCNDMYECTAAAIARKLGEEGWTVDEIGRLFGFKKDATKVFKDNWRYPARS